MGTIIENVLATRSGRASVEAGELVFPRYDLLVIHEVPLLEMWRELQEIGLERMAAPERMIVVSDHEIPVPSVKAAERQKATRKLIDEQGIAYFIKPGRHGIQHQLLVEQGYIVPGQLVGVMDTHALTMGSVGSIAIPMVYEFPTLMATGTIWTTVPTTIRVHINGELNFGVRVRDLAHNVIKMIGAESGDYRCVEYLGSTVARLGIPDRMILCGVAVEIGAKAAVIEPDAQTLEYVRKRARFPYEVVRNDSDAHFEAEYSVSAGLVETVVAAPPSPDNIVPISSVSGTKINSAYIGSCASGTIDELRDAARVLKHSRIHPDVMLLIVPTTQETFAMAAREGLIEVFLESGCHVMGPTCAPCFGGTNAMADGEVRICTGTRNDRGRMGSMNADIYLASAMTVAYSAVKGEIADPRELAVAKVSTN